MTAADARNAFRAAYRPDMPEADKVALWALYAPFLTPKETT